MTTNTASFRNYVTANFNQGQGNNYDLIFPIWFTETHWHLPSASVKASPSVNVEDDSHHRGKNTIYFELNNPSSEITTCRMVVNCDNAVRVLQQSDGEGTGYSQGNGRLLLANAGIANTETSNFTLKNGKNRFIFEVANHGDPHGGPAYLLACALTSDATNNNLIFHTGYNFCKWGGYTSTSYDNLGKGWKWKNGFFSNTSAPVLYGVPSNTTITDQDSYTIPTVTATDTTDGTLTVTVSNGGYTTSGTSSHTIGNYTITFTATDSNSITTTSSYVLTVEVSTIYFPTGQYVKMWTYFTATLPWYHGWLTLPSQTMDLLDETYDPNNTSIRDTDTGLIRSSHRTRSETSIQHTYSFTRTITVDDDEVNVAYIRLKWGTTNIRQYEGTWDSWNSGRWYLSDFTGGLSYIQWMNGNNAPWGSVEVVRVYYLTTSGRTRFNKFYDGMNFLGSPSH